MSDLKSALEAAIKEQDEQLAGSETDEQVEEPGKSDEPIKQEPDKPVEQSAEGQDNDEQPKEPEIELSAPEHWSAQDKEVFGKTPKETQQWLLDRYKDMESGFTKKSMEREQQYAPYKQLDQIISPYRQIYQSQGLNDLQFIANLANTYNALLRDPKGTLLNLSQQFGVDFNQEDDDPRFNQVNQTIQNLQNQLHQTVGMINQTQSRSVEQQLNDFANLTDSQGNKLHPYFDEVMGEMSDLANIAKANGQPTPTLKDLYERACWMNGGVRNKIQTSQRDAENERLRQEAERKKKEEQERANKANLASATVSGDGSTEPPTQDSSIRSLINSQLQ